MLSQLTLCVHKLKTTPWAYWGYQDHQEKNSEKRLRKKRSTFWKTFSSHPHCIAAGVRIRAVKMGIGI